MAGTVKKTLKTEEDTLKWASLLMPWLPPQAVASLASTCTSIRSLSKQITTLRASDFARGLEIFPVAVSNSVDSILYPYFLYTTTSIHSIPHPHQQWGQNFPPKPLKTKTLLSDSEILEGSGCNCSNRCSEDALDCLCNSLRVYTDDGRVGFSDGDCSPNPNPNCEGFGCDSKVEGPLMVMECGPACRCEGSCRNRVSQRGLAVRVEVVRHLNKGWGLHLLEAVKRGTFICEYAGEYLTTADARERQRHYDEAILHNRNFCSALLVIRENLPSGQACLRLNIDATVVGNVARFINHSCDGGNLFPILVRCSGSILPRLCFFASRDISVGDELTFSYGVVDKNCKTSTCFCNTPACCGVLPSEST